jgi:hypothetical protein
MGAHDMDRIAARTRYHLGLIALEILVPTCFFYRVRQLRTLAGSPSRS